jgi:hypothetical protein
VEDFYVKLLRHRFLILFTFSFLTLFFLFTFLSLKIVIDPDGFLPHTHPYLEAQRTIEEHWGAKDEIKVLVQVEEGDIFNSLTLEKIYRISKGMSEIPGLRGSMVYSITTPHIRRLEVKNGIIELQPIFTPSILKSREKMNDFKRYVYSDERIFGDLVSLDSKKALITMKPLGKKFNQEQVLKEINKVFKGVYGRAHHIDIIGGPMYLVYLKKYTEDSPYIVVMTVIALLLVFYLYYTSIGGMVLPFAASLSASIWVFGLMALFQQKVNVLLIELLLFPPLLASFYAILVIAVNLEIRDRQSPLKKQWLPIVLSLLAQVVGFIPLMSIRADGFKEIAFIGFCWILPSSLISFIILPLLLYFYPVVNVRKGRILVGLLTSMEKLVVKKRWYLLAASLIVIVTGLGLTKILEVGDPLPGTFTFWPPQQYNQYLKWASLSLPSFNNWEMVQRKTESEDTIAKAIRSVEDLQVYLEKMLPGVVTTKSIVNELSRLHMVMHGGDPNWYFLPTEEEELRSLYHYLLFDSSWMQDKVAVSSVNDRPLRLSIYSWDGSAEAMNRIENAVTSYFSQPSRGQWLYPAAGRLGAEIAIREMVKESLLKILLITFFLLFLFTSFTHRSFLIGGLLTVPALLSTSIVLAVTALVGINLVFPVLPSFSIGAGMGVSFGIIIFHRLWNEYREHGSGDSLFSRALSSLVSPFGFATLTLILGLFFWCFSFIRFQSVSAILLSLSLVINFFSNLILIPTGFFLLEPRLKSKKQ